MSLAFKFLEVLLCFEMVYFIHCKGKEINAPFNLYTHHAVKMKVPTVEDSLFGFSLALKDESVFVGDPKYDRKGGIFYCNLNNCEDECACSTVNDFESKSKSLLSFHAFNLSCVFGLK